MRNRDFSFTFSSEVMRMDTFLKVQLGGVIQKCFRLRFNLQLHFGEFALWVWLLRQDARQEMGGQRAASLPLVTGKASHETL